MMQRSLPVTAIIVGYYSSAVLPQCVASLNNIEEIIVVDNGGTTKPEDIIFLRNKKNLGFGRAINRGLAKVKTPYTLIINPDAVMKQGALEQLIATLAANSDAAIVSPLLEDGAGNVRTSWRLGHFLSRAKKTRPEIVGTFCVGHIAAAAWLIKTECFKKIGGFDKKIFLFFEDDDMTLRLRQAGYSILMEPAARAVHLQGKSSPPTPQSIFIKNFHYTRSEIYFTRKHRGKYVAYYTVLHTLFNNFFRLWGGILRLNTSAIIAATARLIAVFTQPACKRACFV